jgi:GT2 family glycosyltransferase
MLPAPPLLFSVVIPTRHRNDRLAACLRCLAPGVQSLPAGRYEVIVSDDGASTTAEGLVRAEFPWARWTPGPRRGPAANRNRGATLAAGEWLAFVDDDCEPARDWLERLAEFAQTMDIGIIEGAIHSPGLRDHPLWTAPENLVGQAGWSANLSVRRQEFERLGGFDEDFGDVAAEDVEFCRRARRSGVRWVFAARAVVLHPPRVLTWRQFWTETLRFRWWFLLRLKTGEGPGPQAGTLLALGDVILATTVLYARMTWHLARDILQGRRRGVRRTLFLRARDWLLWPVLVPYFCCWSLRYRALLRRKGGA